jgi:hypothetical protein
MSTLLTHRWRSLTGLLALALLFTACGAAATPTPVPTETPVPPPTPEASGLPDTTGAAMLQYLNEQGYQEAWELWPGKGELYEGTEPHGMLLTTYLNQAAVEALNNKAGSMPDGAIIVKENYMPDGTYDAMTVMYKVPGYNPDHNNWFFTKIGADGAVQAEGRVEGCQACHSAQRENDYIYTGELK